MFFAAVREAPFDAMDGSSTGASAKDEALLTVW